MAKDTRSKVLSRRRKLIESQKRAEEELKKLDAASDERLIKIANDVGFDSFNFSDDQIISMFERQNELKKPEQETSNSTATPETSETKSNLQPET